MGRSTEQTSGKRSWIQVVDQALDKGDRFLDRFRKTPRRRLEVVPHPPPSPDPFVAGPADAGAGLDNPLGDPGLPAQIYGKRTCDKSALAMNLCKGQSVIARMVDLDDPDNKALENRLIRETKRYGMPWVYVRGQFIGGFEELAALAKSGGLTG